MQGDIFTQAKVSAKLTKKCFCFKFVKYAIKMPKYT